MSELTFYRQTVKAFDRANREAGRKQCDPIEVLITWGETRAIPHDVMVEAIIMTRMDMGDNRAMDTGRMGL